jgi:flagellar biosynthetic protein FlhB
MAEGSGGDRTEKATPKRREEARKKGQVARSAELNSAVVLLAGITLVLLSSGHMLSLLSGNAAYLFEQAHLLRADNLGGLRELVGFNLTLLGKALAPLLVAIFIAGLAANVIQVGFHASTEALAFRFDKLNPITGAKRFFNKRTGFELIKNLLKIALITLIAFTTVRGRMAELLATPILPLPVITALGKSSFAVLMFKLLLLLLLLAAIDWAFQKWQHEENLKMSRVETKQELKDVEGDPQIKARMRAIQLETARRRMLADVPTADVVVTNPDHLAVALKYEVGEAAPRVVAKGRNHLAEVIKKIARQARVPVLENKTVARALFRQVKLGAVVPESLYQAVAEILAYVYRLRKA